MKKYKRFVRNYYVYSFFKHFAFIYAVYIVLFRMAGLSVLEISLLLALWSGFVVLSEVPTGALADKWNRKYMLIIGMISKTIGFGVWFFARDFVLFALGFLFWGVGSSFTSGTQEALLFDNLKKFRKGKMYEKVTGNAKFYSGIAIGTSVFLGGIIASLSFDLVIVLSSLFMLVSIIPILSFHEFKAKTSTKEAKYFSLIRKSFRDAMKNRTLLRLIIYSLIMFSVIGTLDEYEQLYFNWLNLPISFFGVVMVVIMFSSALGSKMAYKFKEHFRKENSIYLLSLLSGTFLIIAVSFNSLLLLPFFILVFVLGSIGEVIVESRLQRIIRTDRRATLLSINSLLGELSAVFLTTGFGIVSQLSNLVWGFITFGLLVVLFSIISVLTTFSRK